MFSFRVQGFAGDCDSFWGDSPIDVTVFAKTEAEAIEKVEAVTGKELSALHRTITTVEIKPTDAVEIVRCGECEKRNTIDCVLSYFVCEDFYCPYGERRKDV